MSTPLVRFDELLAAVRALRAQERYEDYVAAAQTLARSHPDEVLGRIEAAYACDGFGTEQAAVVHYDAAWALGVPEPLREEFVLGYGSTLRNVGRVPEALAVLREGCDRYPENRALRCFRALALHTAGRNAEAMAVMLDVVLALADGQRDIERYDRALAHYRDELLGVVGVP
jgi:tetratricopeptide (TPR) repeat protein